MAAVAEEQRRARLQRGAQVERAVAPARGPDDRPQVRADDRRAAEIVASRDATSPTIPTGHGPRTIVAAAPGGSWRSRVARRRPPVRPRIARASAIVVFVRSRRLRLAASSSAASAVASSGVSLSSRRAATSASPIRPAALIRGATANASVSTSTALAATPAAARSAAIPGRGSRRIRSSPRRTIARVSPRIGTMSAMLPIVARSAKLEGGGRAAGLVGEEQLGDLERDAAAGEAPLRV